MDSIDKETRSEMMKKVKSISKMEVKIGKELWKKGLRMRRNVTDLTGKPDFSIKKYKVVIFIDSCFWHACELHGTIPKSNTEFWENKLKRNVERDKKVTQFYQENEWNIMRVWEHEFKQDWETAINKIVSYVNQFK